jgi:hypothetical protein
MNLMISWSSLGTTVRGERGWYEASQGAYRFLSRPTYLLKSLSASIALEI